MREPRSPGRRATAMCSRTALLALLLTSGAACRGCGDGDPAVPQHDAGRPRRNIEPPTGEVIPLPPHAIRADGIGPYKLGASMRSILGLQPHGPRVTLYEIDGLVDYSLVRAEDGALLIGVERSATAVFVAVLDEAMARTEGGVGVGSTRAEVDRAMGEPLRSHGILLDPRMRAYASMPSARFLFSGDRVAAVLIRGDVPGPGPGPGGPPASGDGSG